MARTLPTLLSPIDAYSGAMDRPLGYFESEMTTDDLSTIYCKATLTSGDNAYGVAGYFETHIAGTTSGHIYGLGSWINLDTAGVLSAGNIIVPIEVGVYTGEAEADARIVLMQLQGILNGAPASMHVFRVNTTQTITAIFAAANAGSVCFAAGETASTQAGSIAIADIVGTGVVYINTYTVSS